MAEEIRAQIERCRKHGLRLTHVDSHHHIHEEFGILTALLPLLHEFGIPFIRIMNNLSTGTSRLRRLYTASYNGLLRCRRLGRTRYFGDISQFAPIQREGPRHRALSADLELMVHPVMSNGQVCDKLSGRRMPELIREAALPDALVSFSGAAYDG